MEVRTRVELEVGARKRHKANCRSVAEGGIDRNGSMRWRYDESRWIQKLDENSWKTVERSSQKRQLKRKNGGRQLERSR